MSVWHWPHLAFARNAGVIAVTSLAKASDLLDAGAAHTIDRTAEDLRSLAHRLGIDRVDAVADIADIAGGPFIAELTPLVRDDVRSVIAGAVAGAVVEFDVRRAYLHNSRLVGSSIHAWAFRDAGRDRQAWHPPPGDHP